MKMRSSLRIAGLRELGLHRDYGVLGKPLYVVRGANCAQIWVFSLGAYDPHGGGHFSKWRFH